MNVTGCLGCLCFFYRCTLDMYIIYWVRFFIIHFFSIDIFEGNNFPPIFFYDFIVWVRSIKSLSFCVFWNVSQISVFPPAMLFSCFSDSLAFRIYCLWSISIKRMRIWRFILKIANGNCNRSWCITDEDVAVLLT